MSYRKIHDTFWTDPDLEEYTPEQKFFYIYLITNPRVNQIGLYEFSIRHAALETGYNTDTVSKLLKFFVDAGKIVMSATTRELVVCKFWFHNQSKSPKVAIHVEELLKSVKDKKLIQYIYSMDTQTQEEEEEEEEKEEDKTVPFFSTTFSDVWKEWEKYRKQSRHKLTPSTKDKQLKMLSKYPEHTAIKMIEQSIEKGWQGLFEIKGNEPTKFKVAH